MGYYKPTHTALLLKDALEKHGLRVLAELNDGFKRIDLALPAAHLNIEVDGIQHLTNPDQIEADIDRADYSRDRGYNTIHVPNELVYGDLPRIARAIAAVAHRRIEAT